MPEAAGEVSQEAGPIDRAHLRQMTFGDTSLEREVLGLFDQQAASMLDRMPAAEPRALPALAHALKGSARGVGAWRVAEAAAAAEVGGRADLPRLIAALDEARIAIKHILRRH
ncbi:MAG: hypothetical protein OJF62_000399 [Pseudolabrys sp.]|jgi:HPt (histidine-containing phosphotransfer) domain-containing protein|nr:hypothetical protein [Pseudolabrys sp.]